MVEAEADDNQHWVRRSVRAAGASALEYPHVAKLLEQIRYRTVCNRPPRILVSIKGFNFFRIGVIWYSHGYGILVMVFFTILLLGRNNLVYMY